MTMSDVHRLLVPRCPIGPSTDPLIDLLIDLLIDPPVDLPTSLQRTPCAPLCEHPA